MSWGMRGWADCEQRIRFLRQLLTAVFLDGRTPTAWHFTADGWGELKCCLPLEVKERRKIIRRDPGDNSERLFGLPIFIEGTFHPVYLESEPEYDVEIVKRLDVWATDPVWQQIYREARCR